MAKMIPSFGPMDTGSHGERSVYSALAKGLPEDFTVVHSLPWLSAAVRQMDENSAPTGEIDFIVIHPELGVLVLEVKSGRYRVDGTVFVLIRSDKRVDVVRQTRNNFHGLTQWLGKGAGHYLRNGYGFVFPDSQFGDALISAAMADVTVDPPSKIFIDRAQMPNLAQRVIEIMGYWKATHGNADLGRDKAARIVGVLCPEFDGTPTWASRIAYDGNLWLRLTEEQASVVDQASQQKRMIVSGWPGTGKTLIGIEIARRMDLCGTRALIVTFNSRLSEHIQQQLCDSACAVSTWHKLCALARRRLKLPSKQPEGWFKEGCCEDLRTAIGQGLMEDYDVLILDEAQALQSEWIAVLSAWFRDKQILAFCDESQVFAFEHGTTLEDLSRQMGVLRPFYLTIVMRMPKAVTDRLLSVRKAGYQLTSPRESEPDTIRELLVIDWRSALQETVEEFKQQGVEGEDICVLLLSEPSDALAEELRQLGVCHETVSRFRGLESAIVIVPGAAYMDDIGLFCAYSRATTACVAFYDTEKLAWAFEQEFHHAVIAEGDNRNRLEKVRVESLTRTLMTEEFETGSLSLQTIGVAWSASWKAWLVGFDGRVSPVETWLDYLFSAYPWPIFFWYGNTRRQVYRVSRNEGAPDSIGYGESYDLKHCEACDKVLPHHTVTKACLGCEGKMRATVAGPSPEEVARIKGFDETLALSEWRSPEAKARISGLPIPLAAAGAKGYAFAAGKRSRVLKEELPSGRLLYRSALAFVQSRIALLASGTQISIDGVTDELRKRYASIASLDRAVWRGVIASALATCYQKELVEKIDGKVKGVYIPIDD